APNGAMTVREGSPARAQNHAVTLLVVSLLPAACLILTCGCSRPPAAEEAEAPAPVQVAAVTQDTVRRSVTADGTLFPVDQWNVMPKITAPGQRFLVNRGDQVKKDQLLAVLGS